MEINFTNKYFFLSLNEINVTACQSEKEKERETGLYHPLYENRTTKYYGTKDSKYHIGVNHR